MELHIAKSLDLSRSNAKEEASVARCLVIGTDHHRFACENINSAQMAENLR